MCTSLSLEGHTYPFCYCGIAAGIVICNLYIFLFNIQGHRSSSSPPPWLNSGAFVHIKWSCYWDIGLGDITSQRPHTVPYLNITVF